MRLDFLIASRCSFESSAKPYAQPSDVRCAVDASMMTVFAFSTSVTASFAAASGRHKKVTSELLIASLRAATSFLSSSGRRMTVIS